jgi:hypothetical protein
MGFPNPSNSNEILYGASGDVRNEINAYAASAFAGHYVDETEVAGSLIIRSLERATRLINGYLEVVYANQMPITTVAAVPVLLDDIASDIATFYTLRANQARMKAMSEEKRAQYYDNYIAEPDGILAKIRERKIQLPEFTGAYTDEVKSVRTEGQAPIFDVDDEKNWGVDPRTDQDIQRERGL